MLVLVGPIFG